MDAAKCERSAAPIAELESDIIFKVKEQQFNGNSISIIQQNLNGPCPILALLNVLLLENRIQITGKESVSFQFLCDVLGDYMLETGLSRLSTSKTESDADVEFHLDSVLKLIPTLLDGLDCNPRFDDIKSFELTDALSLFDIFKVNLVHGWCVSPGEEQEWRVCVEICKSYNKLAVLALEDNENGLIAKQFLQSNASQLTYHGLVLLTCNLEPKSFAVLFRNNHYNTLYRDDLGRLWTLVTDEGLLSSNAKVMWESLDSIEGDTTFVDCYFKEITNEPERASPPSTTTSIAPTLPSAPKKKGSCLIT